MYPVLTDGEEIKIVRRIFQDVKPHDWVAFTKDGNLLVHEVLFKSKKYLVSWGVNNIRTDGVIRENQVIGIVDKRQIWRRWHLIYLAEAKSLLHDFEMAGIKNLILKGPPWQIAKYGFLLDKPSSDIDWLVDNSQFGVVKKILKGRGFRLHKLRWIKKAFYQGEIPRVSEMSYVKKILGTNLTIDLHLQAVREAMTAWYKEPITGENMSQLTDYLLGRRVRERKWPVLPNNENLFFLCLNLMFNHAGRGVYQLASIAHIIDRRGMDWKKLEQLAKKYQVKSYLYFPLLWASRIYKVKIPFLNRLEPSPVRLWLAKLVINRFTIIRPISDSDWYLRKINLLTVGYLRLILSIFST